MKLKFALVGLVALGGLAAGGTASAMPAATPDALGSSDGAVIQVKAGHGHGGGHGWGHRGGRGQAMQDDAASNPDHGGCADGAENCEEHGHPANKAASGHTEIVGFHDRRYDAIQGDGARCWGQSRKPLLAASISPFDTLNGPRPVPWTD
jgi:hypothetical protein